MRHILIHELDYNREAQNLIALGKNLEKFEHIVIPQPVLDYSTSKILTMDFVEGQKSLLFMEFKKRKPIFRCSLMNW